MVECLSCQIHVLYRIVVRFTREAVIAQRHVPILEKFKDTHSAYINWETPELTKRSMKGGVATIIVDRQLPNQQKRTVKAFAEGFGKEFNPDDLDEGFIEIHEVSDVLELIDWEEYKPKRRTCDAKRKK